MNTQIEMKRQNLEKTLSKIEWLLARSEQANRCYSRAQMEAFSILQESFRERLDDINVMASDLHMDKGIRTCHA